MAGCGGQWRCPRHHQDKKDIDVQGPHRTGEQQPVATPLLPIRGYRLYPYTTLNGFQVTNANNYWHDLFIILIQSNE